jgi:cytochrome P450
VNETVKDAKSIQTWSQLTFFVLAMTYYPDIQVKARAEIESVIGFGRLPEFSDESNLPYVSRVVQEAFRYDATATDTLRCN